MDYPSFSTAYHSFEYALNLILYFICPHFVGVDIILIDFVLCDKYGKIILYVGWVDGNSYRFFDSNFWSDKVVINIKKEVNEIVEMKVNIEF